MTIQFRHLIELHAAYWPSRRYVVAFVVSSTSTDKQQQSPSGTPDGRISVCVFHSYSAVHVCGSFDNRTIVGAFVLLLLLHCYCCFPLHNNLISPFNIARARLATSINLGPKFHQQCFFLLFSAVIFSFQVDVTRIWGSREG